MWGVGGCIWVWVWGCVSEGMSDWGEREHKGV